MFGHTALRGPVTELTEEPSCYVYIQAIILHLKKTSHLLEQGKQTVVQPYSEKLCAWPLELSVDLWLCTPARLHQISAQSMNQDPTLPLRPGLKINPISLTSRGLTVIHRDEHCGFLTHTHTDGQILTERLRHVVELLLGTADKHHGESSSSKLRERERR